MDKGICLFVIGQNFCGNGSDQFQAALAVAGITVSTVEHTDVGLDTIIHEVQLVATGCFFQINIHSLRDLHGSCKAVGNAFRFGQAVEVQQLMRIILSIQQLIHH